MQKDDEFELIESARHGDVEAFSELVRRYESQVRACLAVRLNDVYQCDDLAQEAFIIAFNKMDSFDESKSFGPWVRGIAFNLLKNYWRKHKATPVGGAAELEVLIDHEIHLEHSELNEPDQLAALRICMTKLDENMRNLLHQLYEDECSIAELTAQHGVKHSTMTMRLHRIREKLKQCIHNQLRVEMA